MKISIIIKALNEEKNIALAIESSLEAIKGMKGEVILADSKSVDRTIEIAKKYPIRIVQLEDENDRSCGMGAQLGYLHTRGEYIYILDGDMKLDKKFIKLGIKELEKDEQLAGIGGEIIEKTESNIVFRRRKKGTSENLLHEKEVKALMMGGLYKKNAIEKVGYFSNPFLHSYEESDLGLRLRAAGYSLKRIPVKMIEHFGDKDTSFQIVLNRWKSRYLWGCGEYLRYHFGKKTFFNVIWELKLYILVLLWWLSLGTNILFFQGFPLLLNVQLIATGIFLILFLVKKLSLSEFFFSIISWNITSLGLVFGFLQSPKNIYKKFNIKVIQ